VTVGECQAEIAQGRALLTDTTNSNYVDSFTNEKDRAGLIGKLDSASTKLSQGKSQDALANLTSVRDKVDALVAQGKLDRADADVLLVWINEAIGCVEELRSFREGRFSRTSGELERGKPGTYSGVPGME
jgi:hypothetical protein